MSSELERTKRALDRAMRCLQGFSELRSNMLLIDINKRADIATRDVESILHPPTEWEDVEIERFIVFYPDGTVSDVLTREQLQGFDCRGGSAKHVAHTIRRAKVQPVERSVSVEALVYANGDVARLAAGIVAGKVFENCPGLSGKAVTLTATWTE